MQTIEADCRSGDETSDYLSTALKGWGIWVSNRLPGSHSAERMGGEKLSGRKKQPYHWGIFLAFIHLFPHQFHFRWGKFRQFDSRRTF